MWKKGPNFAQENKKKGKYEYQDTYYDTTKKHSACKLKCKLHLMKEESHTSHGNMN